MDMTVCWATFASTCRNKKNIRGDRSITLKDATEWLPLLAPTRMDVRSMLDETESALYPVLDEMAGLIDVTGQNPGEIRRRALIFGMATPNRPVASSVDFAVHAAPRWNLFATVDGALSLTTAYHHRDGRTLSMGMPNPLAAYLHGAYPMMQSCDDDEPTIDELESLTGISKKVARMSKAIMNPWHETFTIDLWHLRQILALAGENYAVKPTITNPAYAVLEDGFMNLAATQFPGVPTFAVQWSLWNAAQGEHISHNHLWESARTL
jgi:hypothetical protein